MYPPKETIKKVLFGGIILLLGTLLARTFIVVLSLLSIVKGINIPFLIEKITTNRETLFRATPVLLILSYTLATIIAIVQYRHCKQSWKIGELRSIDSGYIHHLGYLVNFWLHCNLWSLSIRVLSAMEILNCPLEALVCSMWNMCVIV